MNSAPPRPSFTTWQAGGYARIGEPRRADPASLQRLAGRTMGTTWSLSFDHPTLLAREAVQEAVEMALARVVSQMSTWEPDADICRYNRAPAGSQHLLAPEFAEVLACALHWAKASGGAIDPSIGPLIALWGFGAEAAPADAAPSVAALIAARSRVGWQRIAFDHASRTVTQPGGIALDFSGIAKGFAVDQVVAALQALGVRHMLVEIGGELRGVGRRPGGLAWQVHIAGAADALATDTPPRIALSDCAIATSGDRWHTHEADGHRWSHTIDPRSGAPVVDTLSAVSVLHAQCMQADALATLLTVLGPIDGLAFAERHGIAARFVMRATTATTATAATAATTATPTMTATIKTAAEATPHVLTSTAWPVAV